MLDRLVLFLSIQGGHEILESELAISGPKPREADSCVNQVARNTNRTTAVLTASFVAISTI